MKLRQIGSALQGAASGLVVATLILSFTPGAAHAAEATTCPSAWAQFWADNEVCVDHGSDGDLRTCCYFEDDRLLGCCEGFAT